MKKQFLFLLVLVLFAGLNSFGQAINYSDPQPLTGCNDDFTNPIAGKNYTYGATANPANGNFTFWATKDPNFITTAAGTTTFNNVAPTLLTVAPNQLMAAGANYNTAGTGTSVDITWTSGLLSGVTPASPLFVAVHYAAAAGDCSDNFKVYSIIPRNGFTVDVLNLNPTTFLPDASAYAYEPDQCPDVVRNAQWTAGGMNYNYGDDYLYYEFVAANFTGYWIPTFSVSGLDAAQTAVYEYTYDLPNTWNASTVWTTLVSGTTQIATTETNTNQGVSVFVRLHVGNMTFENLAGQTITLALDGQNAQSQWDVVNATCVDPGVSDQNDLANQTILPRPTVLPVAPGVFEN